MSLVTGVSEEEIKANRKGDMPYIRAMVAQTLRGLGYTYMQIGKVLGKKYSTIIMANKKLSEVINIPSYEEVKRINEQYQELVKEYKNYLYGTTTEECIWDVPPAKRICVYCKRPHCKKRKYNTIGDEPESFSNTVSEISE